MPNLDRGDVRIAVDTIGQGAPLLLIHGFPLSRELWTPVMQPLLETAGPAGRRLIMPDLRGFGASTVTETASMADYADDLVSMLDGLGITGPAAVCGLSMGGYIAFELVRRHPARVGALIIADSRAGPDTPEAAKNRRDQAAKVLSTGTSAVSDGMVQKLFAEAADQELKDQWRERMRRSPEKGVAAALLAMAERPDSMPTLATLRVPALFIVGSEDRITPVEVAAEMAETAPGGRLVEIEGAGHMTPVERPAEFAASVSGFLRPLGW